MINLLSPICRILFAKSPLARGPLSSAACNQHPLDPGSRGKPKPRRTSIHARRGFSMVEVMIALAITATLMSAVMMALDASFRAYRATTESASRHTMARLTMHRLLALIRTGSEFGPFPENVITDPIIRSDFIEFTDNAGNIIRIEYRLASETLFVIQDPDGPNESESILIAGVQPQYDAENNRILPFTLQYQVGPMLYRATVDFLVSGNDDNIDLTMEYEDAPPIRLVASAMPRNNF